MSNDYDIIPSRGPQGGEWCDMSVFIGVWGVPPTTLPLHSAGLHSRRDTTSHLYSSAGWCTTHGSVIR